MKNWQIILSIGTIIGVILGCAEAEKKPQWQKAQVFAENLDHPAAIATDENFIYFVTGGTVASLNEGTSGVWKMPLAGGQAIQLFKGVLINERKAILPDTFVLATDENYVYWSSGTIWRTPKNGGESQEITGGLPTKLALDEDKIYWQNFIGEGGPPSPIYSVAKNGGEAKALTEPLIASGIVVDKEFVYWSQSDGIYKSEKNGGEKLKFYSAPEKQNISGLIADKENFYFTQGDGENTLFKISKQGGEAVKIAPGINHVHKFYADETHIYFVLNETSFSTSLNKIAKNGGEITKLDSGYIASFTVGKDKVLVTDISKIYALEK